MQNEPRINTSSMNLKVDTTFRKSVPVSIQGTYSKSLAELEALKSKLIGSASRYLFYVFLIVLFVFLKLNFVSFGKLDSGSLADSISLTIQWAMLIEIVMDSGRYRYSSLDDQDIWSNSLWGPAIAITTIALLGRLINPEITTWVFMLLPLAFQWHVKNQLKYLNLYEQVIMDNEIRQTYGLNQK